MGRQQVEREPGEVRIEIADLLDEFAHELIDAAMLPREETHPDRSFDPEFLRFDDLQVLHVVERDLLRLAARAEGELGLRTHHDRHVREPVGEIESDRN